MIRYYRANVNNDTASNGGKVDYSKRIVDSGIDNVLPSILEDERDNGVDRYRKIFGHYIVIDETGTRNTLAFVKIQPNLSITDRVYMAEGTTTDTQGDIDSGYTFHGSGVLAEAVTANVSEDLFVYTREEYGFNDNDYIFICELSGDNITTSKYEVLRAASASYSEVSGGYSLGGLTNGAGGDVFRQSFLTPSATMVCSCVYLGDIIAESYDLVNPPASAYKGISELPAVNNLGAIDDEWTVTFLNDDGVFELTRAGDVEYSTTGSKDSNFSPVNYYNGQPFFTILSTDWYGTLLEGDSLSFKTKSASFPLWMFHRVASGSDSVYGVSTVISVIGE